MTSTTAAVRRAGAPGGREKRHERDQEARPPAPAPVPRPPGRIQREKAGGERERRDRGAACLPPADERNEPDGGEEAQREVEKEPLVRTHEEAPGPVERRMRKVLPARIGRERTAEANDLEGEHCRDRYGGSRDGCGPGPHPPARDPKLEGLSDRDRG